MSAATLVAQDPIPDFDAGPLSWVQPEIDAALGRGLAALAQFAAAPDEATTLKHARTHVHQAAGALQLVGLDAVVAFTDEIERQLARLDDLPPPEAAKACGAIDGACRKLQIFLEELVNGAPPVPLKLFPEYEAMQRARGVRAAAPTDLFYPDVTADSPRFPRPAVVAAANLPSYLIKQRRSYQRGLLAWLRGDEEGARQMRDAVASIEAATSQANLRAFWWSTSALLDALVERGLEASFGVKQLAARVDLQIRRIAEGSAKVADRLRREVLYFVAISAPVAPSVLQVQSTFKLAGLIPSAEVLSSDLVRLQPHLREARELLGSAKEAWLKCTSGRAENLPKLKETLAAVHRHAAQTGNGALLKLTHALVARLEGLSPGSVSDPVAMEFATALLLAESAFENFAKLSPEFPQHVDLMLARLDAAQASRPFEGGNAAPMLDEMGKRAQDRLLIAQVGREIQANLRHMEQVLDAFFRDHGKRAELASLGKDSRQIRGALRMLGLDTAEALLASCEEQIESYADPDAEIADDALELLAESLSGLGFYIEAVEQQRADHERLIAPLLARRRGESAPAPVAAEDSVEVAVRELRAALPELIAEAHRMPSDATVREALKAKLTVLRDDAELIGDADLAAQAKAALRELEAGTAGTAIAAMAGAAPTPAQAPQVSPETQRILASSDHAVDAELLDVFLIEAAEVLDTVAEQRRVLEHNSGDREALRTVRRQFHTLKGSGRMVGLTELGEIAYEVEKIHNRLLEEERPVTPAVLAMIASAESHFREWVGELRTNGAVLPDPQRLHDTIHRVEEELPRGRESVLRPRLAAPAPAVAPTPAAAPTLVEARIPLEATASVEVPTSIEAPAFVEVPALVEAPPLVAQEPEPPAVPAEVAPHAVWDEAAEAELEAPLPILDLTSDHGFDAPGASVSSVSPSAADDVPAEDAIAAHEEDEFSAAEALASVFAAYENVRNEERAAQETVEVPALGADVDATDEIESTPVLDLFAAPFLAREPEWTPPADLPELGAPESEDRPSLVEVDAFTDVDDGATDLTPLVLDLVEEAPHASVGVAAEEMHLDFLTFPEEGELSAEVESEEDEQLRPQDGAPTLGAGVEDTFAAREESHASGESNPVAEASARPTPHAPHLTLVHDAAALPAIMDEAAPEAESAPAEFDAIELDWAIDEPSFTVDAASLTLQGERDGAAVAGSSNDASDGAFRASPVDAESAEPEPEAADELSIGDVTLPRGLYDILVAEADDHLATVAHELELLQFDPLHELSAAVVRASHTLCGIHRTGGFVPVATTAKALEQCLSALQERGEPLPASALPVLARALASLTTLAARIKARQSFTAEDVAEAESVQAELGSLRQESAKSWPQTYASSLESALLETRGIDDVASSFEAPSTPVEQAAEPAPASESAADTPAPDALEAAILEALADTSTTNIDSAEDEPLAQSLADELALALEAPVGADLPAFIEPDSELLQDTATTLDATLAFDVPASVEPTPDPAYDAVSFLDAPAPVEMPTAVEPSSDLPGVSVSPDAATADTSFVPEMIAVASTSEAAVETPLGTINDEVDEQLLPIFLEEAEELFPQAGEDLRAWRRHPADVSHANGLRRTLHTFKGSARMAGAMRLGELAHRMESRLLRGDDVADGTPELLEALDSDLDRIAFVLDALREGRTNVEVPWPEVAMAGAARDVAAVVPSEPLPAGHAEPFDAAGEGRLTGATASDSRAAVASEAPEPTVGEVDVRDRAMLRVRAELVDRLVNEAGEVSITRARVDGELRALKANLLELTASVIRMRAQVREIEIQGESQIQSHLTLRQETSAEFDPLEFDRYTRFQELTRSLAEGVNDVSTVQQSLLRNVDDAEAALVAQARLLRDVQQQLFAVRTVPFGSMSERLYRILRQVAKELDKRVDLEIRGTQVELDRSVLEKLAGPLEHLLRNAIDHGIEPAEVRARSGKAAMGQIVLTVRQVGNEIAIEITDDGAGLDLARIRARAVAQGRLAVDAEPTEPQLIDCIFQHGFSTAAKLTAVSGRGIGMDVVRSEIAALGGRVEVGTRAGQGTTFLLYLPLTLAVAQAVLVRAGGRVWAVPASMVEQVQQLKAEALVQLYSARRVLWQGREYAFHYLPRLLGELQQTPVTGRSNPVLLLRTGQGAAAVHVDEMVGNQEVVVKNIGPQLARVSGIAGATVLGTGEIVLIINPVQLAHRADVPRFDFDGEDRVVRSSQAAPEAQAGPPLALVVDDSLTVRKITSRLLTREGFQVETAKDGMEALQRLDERIPDVILLDIEMPRMDGFEFTKTIKADPRHAHIPIVMITSRTADKHRSRAKDLGVDLYLGKPYQEEELLRHLHDMLSVAA